MTKKIIVIGLILFLIYNAALYFLPIQKRFVYTDVEKIEKFLYSGRKYTVITAGSSLIGNFTFEAEKRKNYFNLSLPPGGAGNGVKLLALADRVPDTLYIETNYISRGFNNTLLDNMLNKRSYYGKMIFPAFQERNKLLPLIVDKLKSGNVSGASKTRPPKELFDKLMASTTEEYSHIPDSVSYYKNLNELKLHVDYLISKGCKSVAFFEVPIEHQLANSPKLLFQRKAVMRVFNGPQYKFIAPDTTNIYYTGDGKHLLEESFVRFTKYFKAQTALLNNK